MMKIHSISILILLCLYSRTTPAMEQQPPALPPAAGPATATAVGATPSLPPIFIGQQVPRFPIRGEAVAYSGTLKTMRDVVDNPQEVLYPIAQYADKQLDFVARLINFLYTEQQARDVIDNNRVIAFIKTHTADYRDIPFNQVLELINFFDIPDAFSAITSAQPLPLPTTPAEERLYNQQLDYVFNLARLTTQRAYDREVKKEPSDPTTYETAEIHLTVGSEELWQLFGRMLYPNYTKYPEVVKMIDFITTKRGGIFVRTVRTIGRKVGSWLGAPKPSEPVVQKTIEQIVLGAYMQQHPELYTHLVKEFRENSEPEPVMASNISPDGRMLASILLDNTIRLWNLAEGSSRELRGHTALVISVAFSPDSRMLASGSFDNTIRLWNLADGSSRELRGHTAHVISVAFSPDGRMLASGSFDNTIRLWNLADGSSRELRGHTAHVLSVVFSPDSKMLASGSFDDTIRLWNVTDGSFRELRGHTGKVESIAFSPDGRVLASGSLDNTIRLWNLADGSSRELKKLTDEVMLIAFNPDGRTLITETSDSIIRLFGYLSLREALQAPIIPTPAVTHTPATDSSSAAPSAPARPASPR